MNNKPKDLFFADNARSLMASGVKLLSDAVKVTMGPRGRNVVLASRYDAPRVTKDGVSVAEFITLKNQSENIGAQLLKEVASKTAETAGDGTTTSIVLASAIVFNGIEQIENGADPISLKRGIDIAISHVIEYLKNIAEPCVTRDDFYNVAFISSNGDDGMSTLIADAFKLAGVNGLVKAASHNHTTDDVRHITGMEWKQGYLTTYFINDNEKQIVRFEQPHVLIVDGDVQSMDQLLPLLQNNKFDNGLIIIADDFDRTVISTLGFNAARNTLKVVAVKAPGYGARRTEMLEDIAVMTGGSVVGDGRIETLETTTMKSLGRVESLIVNKGATTLIGGHGEESAIDARVQTLKGIREQCNNPFDLDKLNDRIASLTSGVSLISVGGESEVEVSEKVDRYDDAICAVRAAIEEGIVAGGGAALIHSVNTLDKLLDEMTGKVSPDVIGGIQIVRESIRQPMECICRNAGIDTETILVNSSNIQNHPKPQMGFNVVEGCTSDLIADGVIDPVKVTISALKAAGSVAGLMITTDCMVMEIYEEGGINMGYAGSLKQV